MAFRTLYSQLEHPWPQPCCWYWVMHTPKQLAQNEGVSFYSYTGLLKFSLLDTCNDEFQFVSQPGSTCHLITSPSPHSINSLALGVVRLLQLSKKFYLWSASLSEARWGEMSSCGTVVSPLTYSGPHAVIASLVSWNAVRTSPPLPKISLYTRLRAYDQNWACIYYTFGPPPWQDPLPFFSGFLWPSQTN